MIKSRKIDVNSNYYIKVVYNDIWTNDQRDYRLYKIGKGSEDDKLIAESFNRDSFLLKARDFVKLTSNIENVVASI